MTSYVQIRHEEYVALREEVQMLRRKFKYIQGVSTVFRQRVAFIVTDLSQRPDEITNKDLQLMYAKAIRELRVLDTELSTTAATETPHESPLDADRRSTRTRKATKKHDAGKVKEMEIHRGVGSMRYALAADDPNESDSSHEDGDAGDETSRKVHSAPTYEELANQLNTTGVASTDVGDLQRRASAWERDKGRWEDVRKAHHLCTLLAEKNEATRVSKQLREEVEASGVRHSALKAKYERLLSLLQDKNVHGATDPQSVALQSEMYEQRVAALQDEITELKTNLARAEQTLRSNPSGLVNDVQPVTEEVGSLQRSNTQLQQEVRQLQGQLAAVKAHSAGVITEVQGSTDKFLARIWDLQQQLSSKQGEAQDLTAEVYDLRKEQETLHSHVGHYVTQLEALSHEHETLSRAFEALKRSAAEENDELAGAVTEYASHVSERDAHVATIRKELLDEKQRGRQLAVQNRLLQTQLESARGQLADMREVAEQRSLHQHSALELRQRMGTALQEMQDLHSSGPLSERLSRLHDQIGSLEGVEAQLRLKDDQLALVQDECDKLRASHDELYAALNSVSALFASMPASVADMEKLLLEYDVYSTELRRCSKARTVPDVSRVEGLVEMRLMEAKHTKREVLMQHGKAVAARGRDQEGDGESLPYEHLLNVPPPPALVDITTTLANVGPRPGWQSPSPAAQGGAGKAPHSPTPSSLQRDARTAFDLFAEKGPTGEALLVGDQVRLCWETLGLDTEDLRRALTTFRPSVPAVGRGLKAITFGDLLTLAATSNKR